jgi:ATP-dependent helicase/DNAse subunit B
MERVREEEFFEQMVSMSALISLPMSNSRIDTYKKCPQAYKRSYVLGETTETSDPLRIGSTIHSVLETYSATDSDTVDDILIIAEGAIAKEECDNGTMSDEAKEIVRTLIMDYYDSFKNYKEPIGLEVPWELFIGPAHFRGIIDRLEITSKNPLSILVRDFKSSKKAKTLEEMKKDTQMGLYAIAVKQTWPDAIVTCALDYLRLGKVVKHTFTEQELQSIKQDILDTVKDILFIDEDFKPKSFNDKDCLITCAFCGLNHKCGIGKHQKRIWDGIVRKRELGISSKKK